MPTPKMATITVTSVSRSATSGCSIGEIGDPPGSGSRPIRAPAATNAIGAENARVRTSRGSTAASRRAAPASRYSASPLRVTGGA